MFDCVNVTGFLAFGPHKVNPTALIIDSLSQMPNQKIISLKKLDVCTKDVDEYLEIASEINKNNDNKRILNLHFGVAPIENYRLEKCCYNNKDFRIPDNNGYQPHNCQICDQKPLDDPMETTIDLEPIAKQLSKKHDVEISLNPGRYLCNYIYYTSLMKLCNENITSLFVHIPPVKAAMHQQNMQFAKDLLEILLK